MVETLVETSSQKGSAKGSKLADPGHLIRLSETKPTDLKRLPTKIPELDRTLGGGFVLGHVALLAGEPGVGKSTLLLQVASSFENCIYVAGEESSTQIKLRADRLGITGGGIVILDELDVDAIIATLSQMANKPSLVIVDSIQSITTSDLRGVSGSVGQVRECASRLARWAKKNQTPLIMVGQITKGGSVAGPAALSHLVDTVLWFEGDREKNLRILRATKNRFGATDETGIFSMEEKGLVGFEDFSGVISGERYAPGSAVACVLEGTRPVLVEVQALVVPSKLPVPRRVSSGFDLRRVDVILAVLSRHGGLPVYDRDVFVSVTEGMVIRDVAADMALAMAIASSVLDTPLSKEAVFVGEVGLMGEVRPVRRSSEREKVALRRGLTKFISSANTPTISDAIRKLKNTKLKTVKQRK